MWDTIENHHVQDRSDAMKRDQWSLRHPFASRVFFEFYYGFLDDDEELD